MNQYPCVSVIVPAYQVARFVGETLQSVFAQTFSDFEVIVVDDGSPDGPELDRVIAGFGSRVIYRKQANQGAAAARNTAIREAKGDWLAFLDGDDLWLPNHLASQMAFLEQGGWDMAWSDAAFFGKQDVAGKRFSALNRQTRPVTLESLTAEESVPLASTVVARRSAVERAGLFKPVWRRVEDYDLWLRMALDGARMDFNPTVTASRRIHAGAATASEILCRRSAAEILGSLLSAAGANAQFRRIAWRKMVEFEGEGDLAEARIALRQRDYPAAVRWASEASAKLNRPRLKVGLAALRLAPELVRLYEERRQSLYA